MSAAPVRTGECLPLRLTRITGERLCCGVGHGAKRRSDYSGKRSERTERGARSRSSTRAQRDRHERAANDGRCRRSGQREPQPSELRKGKGGRRRHTRGRRRDAAKYERSRLTREGGRGRGGGAGDGRLLSRSARCLPPTLTALRPVAMAAGEYRAVTTSAAAGACSAVQDCTKARSPCAAFAVALVCAPPGAARATPCMTAAKTAPAAAMPPRKGASVAPQASALDAQGAQPPPPVGPKPTAHAAQAAPA